MNIDFQHRSIVNTIIVKEQADIPYYVLKMHANLLNINKIKEQCDKTGSFAINIYHKHSEMTIISRMKPKDYCLIVHTAP